MTRYGGIPKFQDKSTIISVRICTRSLLVIKSLIIIFLIYIIGSLVIGKPDNVEILKNTLSATKEYFSKGVDNVENKLKEADP
jgi:hypothetical protein